MRFEWDEDKNSKNQEKHGISFELAADIFKGPWISRIDDRFDYGEERRCALGTIEGFVLFVIYTLRSGAYRIISARMASKEERGIFYGIIERAAAKDPWNYEGE
jgi:uncharacterized protein